MSTVRLKIVNETKWSTRDLRRFFLSGMKAKGIHGRRDIKVVTGKIHGLAAVGTGHPECYGISIRMTMPKAGSAIDYKRLAQVLEHELDHTLGLDHRDMLNWWELGPTWHEGLTIALYEPVKIAALLSGPEKREAHVRAMLKKADTRMRRAKTIRAKWAKKARYYDLKEQSA